MAHPTRDRLNIILFAVQCSCPCAFEKKKMAQVNKERTVTWQWNHRMTEHLLTKLREYKNEMDYQNIDFNKDVVTMYSQSRERMAERFPDSFGPV